MHPTFTNLRKMIVLRRMAAVCGYFLPVILAKLSFGAFHHMHYEHLDGESKCHLLVYGCFAKEKSSFQS
jgi:hypothetical protein